MPRPTSPKYDGFTSEELRHGAQRRYYLMHRPTGVAVRLEKEILGNREPSYFFKKAEHLIDQYYEMTYGSNRSNLNGA